jgi:hypothetical protein
VRPRAGLGRTAGRALRAAACDADAARSGPGIGSEARAWRAQRYVCHAVGNIAAQAPAWAGRFAEPAFAGALLAPAAGGAGEAVRADALAALARLARHHPAVLAQARHALGVPTQRSKYPWQGVQVPGCTRPRRAALTVLTHTHTVLRLVSASGKPQE